MRILMGTLLAITALSPTLASGQTARMHANAAIDRDDGRGSARTDWQHSRDGTPITDRAPGQRGEGGPAFGVDPQLRQDASPHNPEFSRTVERPADHDRIGARSDHARASQRGGPGSAGANRARDRFDVRDDARDRGRFAERARWNRNGRGDDRTGWTDTDQRTGYRLPRYEAPGGRGAGYRRVAIGGGLSAPLWSRDTWIADPYAYRLPRAHGAFRWVRYYDDALLVDQRTGRVVDAAYGIFW